MQMHVVRRVLGRNFRYLNMVTVFSFRGEQLPLVLAICVLCGGVEITRGGDTEFPHPGGGLLPHGPPLPLHPRAHQLEATVPPQVPPNSSHTARRFATYEAKYPRIGGCDGIPAAHDDFTIVTALFDLKRERWPFFKRRFPDYLSYARQLLNLNVPIVAFVQEDVRDFVVYHRQGKEHLTKIITTSIEQLEYYKRYYARIKAIMESEDFREGHQQITHPEGFSPEYNIIMNAKYYWLYHAVALNYFRTAFFYWMDMGYGHGAANLFPRSCNWAPRSIMSRGGTGDTITYIELNRLQWITGFFDLYKRKIPPFLNGGFFGGPKNAVIRYYFLHKRVFEDYLAEGIVDDDQNMAVAAYFEEPELFNLVEGWWYDVFTLFR